MSMYVDFNQHSYMALVILHQKDGLNRFCEVSFLDADLNLILSDEMLLFDLKDGLKPPDELPNQLAGILMDKTLDSLRRTLESGCVKHE